MVGYPKRKPRIKCEKCNKHYIPSEQIEIRCGYFWVKNPFCKKCKEQTDKELKKTTKNNYKTYYD